MLIAAYNDVRPTRPIEHASAIERQKGVILFSPVKAGLVPGERVRVIAAHGENKPQNLSE